MVPAPSPGRSLTSGSQAVVLEVQRLQPMQPGELPGVDLLQLVVLGGRGGDSEETTPGGAHGSCPIRGLHTPQSIPRSQSLCWAPPGILSHGGQPLGTSSEPDPGAAVTGTAVTTAEVWAPF